MNIKPYSSEPWVNVFGIVTILALAIFAFGMTMSVRQEARERSACEAKVGYYHRAGRGSEALCLKTSEVIPL